MKGSKWYWAFGLSLICLVTVVPVSPAQEASETTDFELQGPGNAFFTPDPSAPGEDNCKHCVVSVTSSSTKYSCEPILVEGDGTTECFITIRNGTIQCESQGTFCSVITVTP